MDNIIQGFEYIITPLIKFKSPRLGISFFSRIRSAECTVNLGGLGRRLRLPREESYILFKCNDEFKLEKIEFDNTGNFDFIQYLEANNIAYKLYKDTRGCVGAWEQGLYSWPIELLKTAKASITYIEENDEIWGQNIILGVDFLASVAKNLIVNDKEIDYIKINGLPPKYLTDEFKELIRHIVLELTFEKIEMSFEMFKQFISDKGMSDVVELLELRYKDGKYASWINTYNTYK